MYLLHYCTLKNKMGKLFEIQNMMFILHTFILQF